MEPVAISNSNNINLTAYAVGGTQNLYVIIINKTHRTTHDITDAAVMIQAAGFTSGRAASMIFTDGDPGNAARMTVMLGGAPSPTMHPGKENGCRWTVLKMTELR